MASSYDHGQMPIRCKSDSLMMCSGTAVASVFNIEDRKFETYNEEKDSYNATNVDAISGMWDSVKYVDPGLHAINLNNLKTVSAIDKCYAYNEEDECDGDFNSSYGFNKHKTIQYQVTKRYSGYTMNSAPIYHECPMGIYAIKKEQAGQYECAKKYGGCEKANDKSECYPNLYRLTAAQATQCSNWPVGSYINCRETHYFQPYFKLKWDAYIEGGGTESDANSSLNHYNAIIDSKKGIYGFIFTNSNQPLEKAMKAYSTVLFPNIPFIVMTNLGKISCAAQGAPTEFTKFVSTSDRSFSNTECVKCLLEDGEIAGYSKVRNVTECVEKCSKVTPNEKDFYAECIRLEKRGELGRNGVEGQTICDAVALGIMEKRLGDK